MKSKDYTPSWDKVELSLMYIMKKRSNISINDTDVFDKFSCVQNYVSSEKKFEWKESQMSAGDGWVEIFKFFNEKMIQFENISKIVEFCLCLPGSNAPIERVFSILNNVWTNEKNNMKIETIRSILICKCNYELNCIEFKNY